jgi:signal transduction histidine kinase
MARLSLRARVTLAFVLATAVVLAALGFYLHQRLASELDASITTGLRQRAGDLASLAESAQTPQLGRNSLVEPGDDVTQVLAADGTVVATAPGLERQPLLTPAELQRALHEPVSVAHRAPPGEHEAVRLLAVPAGQRVAIVGASVESRDDALASLDQLLLLGLPAALVIAGLAGYLAAGRALRPVTRLSRRAEGLGAGDLAERMPVPAAHDEVRRLAESLNTMLARLQDAFARERAFVADASHELRTPLARLKAELELAAGPGRSEADLRWAVASAAEETDHLVTLANDLLVLARADQGRLPIRRESIELAALLDALAPHATVTCPRGLVIDADSLRLSQAIVNLLENADKHGRPPIRVEVKTSAMEVTIHVRDAGDGIPAEFGDRAFERFTRGDTAREGDGAGLGLALVRIIAQAHGGGAGIGDPASGSDVWLRLPHIP